RAGEAGALLAGHPRRPRRLELRERHRDVGDSRDDPQIEALHALAGGIAVEPAVARLELGAQRFRRVAPRDLDLVVLAAVAQVGAPLHGDAVQRYALLRQRRHALRPQLALPVGRGPGVPRAA